MQRKQLIAQIDQAFRVHPVVTLLGPRQCGKTTLSKMYIEKEGGIPSSNYFDLEDPTDLERLNQPKTILSQLEGLIVIDEIQRREALFPLLRVLVDNQNLNQRYLILGSASRDLIKQSSETLAGRVQHLEVTPFSYLEAGELKKLWVRGGFPRAFLAQTEEDGFNWRKAYMATVVERDIPNLGFQLPPQSMQRFWSMLAHYHTHHLNTSEIGVSLGISDTTVKHYLDILVGTFMVRRLLPWYENMAKRQVKTSKIYIRDSGIYHNLMHLKNLNDMLGSPKLGASWEGFALEEIIRVHDASSQECYFWGIHSQGELDLLIVKDGKKIGFEFKHSDAPKMTSSLKMAMECLKLDELNVIYPGDKNYPLAPSVRVFGLASYLDQFLK